MEHRSARSDRCEIEHDAVLRLAGARDAIEAILQGRWTPEADLVEAIADLVKGAGWRFEAAS